MSSPTYTPPAGANQGSSLWVKGLLVVLCLFVFLVGVRGLGDGFKLIGADLLDSFFAATANPLVALMVGLLATTLVQSSSVTTSMIVGMVAAPDNPLPLANAIPMVMGANIGTTVTNTVVALAHLGRKDEFRRAFAVATCHDFFNFMSVAILLPLELATGYLRATAAHLADFFSGMTGVEYDSPISASLKASVAPLIDFSKLVSESAQTQGILISILSGVLIFGALLALVKTLRSAILAKAETFVEDTLGRSALLAILIGIVVTVMVQSSSITTSLLVPLAGAGVLTLQSAFPVTLGANIGTTVTALLASMAVSGENAQAGVTIALVHTLFNLSGTLLIYPVPAIRRIPLAAAEKLAEIATRSRKWAILYVMILFYGIPALFALLDRWL